MAEILLGNIRGPKGAKGDKGDKGHPGADGYSPVKGVDYYTEEEKADFLNEVLREPSTRYANALKGNASGEIVSITDVSPVEHNLGVKVSSKNLFNNDASLLKVLNYIDGNGTGTYTRVGYEIELPVGTYTISATPKGEVSTPYYIYGYVINKDNRVVKQAHTVIGTECKTVTFVINEGDKLVQVDGTINLDIKTAQNLFEKFDIMLEKGTTATPYTPYVEDLSTVKLTACGKNLFNNDTSLIKQLTTTSADGTSKKYYGYEIHLPAGTYTLTGDKTVSGAFIYLVKKDKNGKNIWGDMKDSFCGDYVKEDAYFLADTVNYSPINIKVNNDEVIWVYDATSAHTLDYVKNLFSQINIQIEKGETATEYEPYTGQAYSPNADGIVENVKSIYPNTTLLIDTQGVLIDCEYNKDINKAFAELQNAIISLGGNV